MEYLDIIEFWHWWAAAVTFLIFEVFAPGVVFIWIAISAAIIGAMLFAFPNLTWELQFSIWGVLAVLSAVVGRNYIRRNPIKTDEPNLNKRGNQYIGRTFTLDNTLENGMGKIKVDDSIWKVEAVSDLKKGTKIKITGLDGVIFKIEKA
ncbi:MAG: NfeD family protein [Alphaproteobacteria bacterium]|nr:NfeD family protein [Alphaproteobacteria bacterium]